MDVLLAKEALLNEVGTLQEKFELSKTVTDSYYEPGMMEYLEQYRGELLADGIVLRTEIKGLRYEGRTLRLEKLSVGDAVKIVRDSANSYNANNFSVLSSADESLGTLPAELCNALAPLYDLGYVVMDKSTVSYLEKIGERSRYAKQGVLFIEIRLRFLGV